MENEWIHFPFFVSYRQASQWTWESSLINLSSPLLVKFMIENVIEVVGSIEVVWLKYLLLSKSYKYGKFHDSKCSLHILAITSKQLALIYWNLNKREKLFPIFIPWSNTSVNFVCRYVLNLCILFSKIFYSNVDWSIRVDKLVNCLLFLVFFISPSFKLSKLLHPSNSLHTNNYFLHIKWSIRREKHSMSKKACKQPTPIK